jgi:ABC-type Mn2+/Zn2+ transport system permease subunit
MKFFINHIILISLDADLAKIRNVNVGIIELSSLITLALVVSVTIQNIGALLITALLIIPAASC